MSEDIKTLVSEMGSAFEEFKKAMTKNWTRWLKDRKIQRLMLN